MNYHIIPTKPHDASLMIRTTTAASIVPIISNSFFNSIPNIKAQFNITYLAKQHNMSDEDIIHMMKQIRWIIIRVDKGGSVLILVT